MQKSIACWIIGLDKEFRIIYQNTVLLKQEHTETRTFEQYIKTRYRQQENNRM